MSELEAKYKDKRQPHPFHLMKKKIMIQAQRVNSDRYYYYYINYLCYSYYYYYYINYLYYYYYYFYIKLFRFELQYKVIIYKK